MPAPRVSFITLGVADLARSRAFYEAWGWTPAQAQEGIVFFQANGVVIGLFGREDLAADQGRPGAALGTGAMTLAQNYPSEAEVDAVVDQALAAGATLLKRPEKVSWGGYSGYVADPDGHVWEVAMNPFSPVGPDGTVAFGG
ncbi:VOC family protein [Demequina lignilytica]|uniref:VOC family protein n=1 Tax=Demequina lignilytica TaxID=3051663 RepID=A0AB35MF16_9MICO|nr:VOC family protein [Demequina sp. SYSU T0a273]MDN4482341.1 VOC family protein [Demequina sp. SYSU T0a273]